MKRVMLLVAVCACSGGTKVKPTTPTPSGIPGVVWQTELEPWRLPHASGTLLVVGDTAVFGGPAGWLTELDLKTGKVIRDRKLPMGNVTDLANLGNNRLIAVGLTSSGDETTTAAFVVDAGTLEPTPIPLSPRLKPLSFAIPHVVVVPDGGVMISGRGLPLAIYDSKTWQVRTTFDTQLGWSRLVGRGEIVLAERGGLIKRINLVTNGQRDLPRGTPTHLAAGDGIDATRIARGGKWIAELYPEGGAAVPLPDAVDWLGIDGGNNLITVASSELRIHALPSGEIKKRIPLDKRLTVSAARVLGRRMFVFTEGLVQMIDLETGVATPKTLGNAQAQWLAVANDGTVLAGNEPSVWTLAAGKLGATEPIESGLNIGAMRADPARYMFSKSDDGHTKLTSRTVGDTAPKTLTFDYEVASTWMARDGSMVFEDSDHHQVLRLKAAAPEVLFKYNTDAEVLAADAETDVMISLDGRVAVVGQDGKLKSTIRLPYCESTLDFGNVEPNGPRAATFNDRALALWDRTTGKLLANVKVDLSTEIVFIPKRQEMIVTFDDRVVVWTPAKGARVFKYTGVIEPAVSADGKKLALSFYSGHIMVFDLDALIAGAPLGADLPASDPIPETCGEADPMALSKADDDDDPPPEEDVWDGD